MTQKLFQTPQDFSKYGHRSIATTATFPELSHKTLTGEAKKLHKFLNSKTSIRAESSNMDKLLKFLKELQTLPMKIQFYSTMKRDDKYYPLKPLLFLLGALAIGQQDGNPKRCEQSISSSLERLDINRGMHGLGLDLYRDTEIEYEKLKSNLEKSHFFDEAKLKQLFKTAPKTPISNDYEVFKWAIDNLEEKINKIK